MVLFYGYTLLYFYLHPYYYLLPPLLFQAAADFAKTRLPEALRQQLLIYERERERDREKDREKADRKERSGLSYPSILEQQILNVDREMLDKLSASYNEAGTCVFDSGTIQFLILWERPEEGCGRSGDPQSKVIVGSDPGSLNRHIRWRLRTRGNGGVSTSCIRIC